MNPFDEIPKSLIVNSFTSLKIGIYDIMNHIYIFYTPKPWKIAAPSFKRVDFYTYFSFIVGWDC